jgi:hypothetical protein
MAIVKVPLNLLVKNFLEDQDKGFWSLSFLLRFTLLQVINELLYAAGMSFELPRRSWLIHLDDLGERDFFQVGVFWVSRSSETECDRRRCRRVNRTVSGREEISFFKELSVVNAAGK